MAWFYLFAALTLAGALMVVANPFSHQLVTRALFLALTLVAVAGVFGSLGAYFLSAAQIMIYAGAVIVLFLWVPMTFDPPASPRRRRPWVRGLLAGLGAVSLALMLGRVLGRVPMGGSPAAPLLDGSAAAVGRLLFLEYWLPFEVLSVLLVAAMVGVVWLSRKEAR